MSSARCGALMMASVARIRWDDYAVAIPAFLTIVVTSASLSITDGIAWGTGEVMAQTRARLIAVGARWHELRVVHDVDRPADLGRARERGWVA